MAFRDSRELFYVLFPPLFLPTILIVNLPVPLLLGAFVSANLAWLRTHHTRHHELARMEKGNFNVSFPLWDWLLGTMLPPAPAR